jgi:Cu+-exporting ATPase
VVFDKTGTLSTGHLVISARVGEDGYLPLVKGMEMNSNHPLSKSIIESLPNVTAMKLNDVNEVPGFGLTYKEFVLGSEKTSLGKGLNVSMQEFIKKHESSSLVFLSNADTILLIIALDDGLVPDAKQTIEALKKKGIKSYMLTGDRKTYALKVGGELGINEECIYSEATPSDKAKILADIRKKEGVICYVGDGINDTLALKESDMSFASYKGSEIASSSADGVLLKPELMTIYYALLVSKKTYINIIENFVWAIVYNLSMIPLTIMGILPMSFCGLVMIVSNLTLTINSLRIKFYKPNKEGL